MSALARDGAVKVLLAAALLAAMAGFSAFASAADRHGSSASPVGETTGFRGVGLGLGLSSPMGESYQSLRNTLGLTLEGWQPFSFFPPMLSSRLSLSYRSFNLKTLNDTSYRMYGFLAGLQAETPVGHGFAPYFAAQIGFEYQTLSFKDSGAAQNAATAFTSRFIPGLSWSPATIPVGAFIEMPIEVLSKGLVLWNGMVGVRVKL